MNIIQALDPFCRWLQNQPFALYISGSTWIFPWVQLVHYTGMGMWVGSSVLIDLRILGWMKADQTIGKFARELLAFNWTALCIGLVGAIGLFSANAVSYLHNAAFDVKFPLVVFGVLFHGFLQGKALKAKNEFVLPSPFKVAAFAEIVIWVSVVTAATRIPNQ
jgi:hypothetical protein